MKKITIFIVMLILALSIFSQNAAPSEGDKTGTTTNDVVVVDSLYPGRFAQAGITFENTGSSGYDISYWFKLYRSAGATNPYKIYTATDLADDDIVNLDIGNVCYKITIETESTVDGNHSDYEFSYSMRWD